MSTTRAPELQQSADGLSRNNSRGGSAYEMRPLATDAERAEAAALVEDRLGWLAHRGLPVPCRGDVPALYRDDQAESVGLFEDGVLLSCLLLDRHPDLGHWGTEGIGRSLLLSHTHTLPGRSDNVVWLVTLWASDYAARLDLPHVRSETPARHALDVDPIARFLNRLQHMGWEARGSGPGTNGERVARLELRSKVYPRLTPFIRCTVPLTPQVESRTDRSAP
ncbi:hypothetical protein [Streptomyces sp. JJ38]|uniref:hypothetical protein n=1 Tax=Streptomyces sp. JJ38 TaxID=2738128 RepID=UPI001C58D5F3|nr:hypothetical protein [Streptomyces sp. JJ38]MBW1597208.1 hypothetical protein [Streptomyces sp. JJ38]